MYGHFVFTSPVVLRYFIFVRILMTRFSQRSADASGRYEPVILTAQQPFQAQVALGGILRVPIRFRRVPLHFGRWCH